jgi:hypothetical protein
VKLTPCQEVSDHKKSPKSSLKEKKQKKDKREGSDGEDSAASPLATRSSSVEMEKKEKKKKKEPRLIKSRSAEFSRVSPNFNATAPSRLRVLKFHMNTQWKRFEELITLVYLFLSVLQQAKQEKFTKGSSILEEGQKNEVHSLPKQHIHEALSGFVCPLFRNTRHGKDS